MSFRNLKAWAAVPAVLWWSGVSSAALYAQTFEKSKMYVEQDHKLKLKRVTLDVQDDAVVATLKGKDADVLRIPYGEITAMEYEKSKHRRWKTGIILFAPMLIMKGKKHWFAVIRGERRDRFPTRQVELFKDSAGGNAR